MRPERTVDRPDADTVGRVNESLVSADPIQPGVVLRPARGSDVDDAAVYHRRCWEVAFTHLVEPPGRLMDLSGVIAMLTGWFDADTEFDARVAELDGRVIAHVVVSGNEVLHLFVDPTHHGRGVGRQLLTVAEGLIIDAGHARGVLQTIVGNIPAIGLYESAGWIVTDEVVPLDHDGVQYDEHVLVKRLNADAHPPT